MKIRFWVVCDEMGEVIKNSPNFKTQKDAYKWIGKNLNPGRYELCLIDWVGTHLNMERYTLFNIYQKIQSIFVSTINYIKENKYERYLRR